MKILVLSDSHSSLWFMRTCIAKMKPDHIVHLGDHYEDGRAMAEENSHIIFHQVPGNCDRVRWDTGLSEILCYTIGGVRFYMTHGHRHYVKSGLGHLLVAAREEKADAVLFGHTHQPCCIKEGDMYVLNPGSCASGGSAGIIEVENEKISACRIIRQADLDEIR